MAQKKNKKKTQLKKPITKVVEPVATVVTPAGPSLVASSASFTPKSRSTAPVIDELLQVRKTDIAKIGFLLAVMLVFLVTTMIINDRTTILLTLGTRLSHAMRLQ